VPTVAEAGYPGFEIDFFEVMGAPAGIPEEIRAMLEREGSANCGIIGWHKAGIFGDAEPRVRFLAVS
jgi:hypothetical protein